MRMERLELSRKFSPDSKSGASTIPPHPRKEFCPFKNITLTL